MGKCQCVQDGMIGWITIAGNQGTAFLEPARECAFKCVLENVLTDDLQGEGKVIRSVAAGEVIDWLESPGKDAGVDAKRIKGKARSDGATGWLTLSNKSGSVF